MERPETPAGPGEATDEPKADPPWQTETALVTLASARVLNTAGPRVRTCLVTGGPIAVAIVVQMFKVIVT